MPDAPVPESMLAALRHVWMAVRALDVPAALMGGLALATWKYPRATRDIDLLVGMADMRPERLVEILRASRLRPKRADPVVHLGQLDLLQFLYQPPESCLDIQIDLLLAISPYHRQALHRRAPLRLADFNLEIDVLSCEDLILHKLLAGRVIDLADSAALLAANRDSLDYGYLAGWIETLGLSDGFRQAWQSAWPDETMPSGFAR